MGLDAGEDERYRIAEQDALLMRAYQICREFHLTYQAYSENPAWWNDACYALMKTENKAQSDKAEEANARART